MAGQGPLAHRLADRFSALPSAAQWAAVAVASVIVTSALLALSVPAAGLLGPMLAAIAFCGLRHRIRVTRRFFHAGQCVIGCLIASALPAEVLFAIHDDWMQVLVAGALTLGVSLIVSRTLVATGAVEMRAAIWGMMPGGASAMIAMADASGADARLVAFMQYLRVASVAMSAALVSSLLPEPTVAAAPLASTSVDMTTAYAFGAGVYVVGLLAAIFLPIPAGAMLYPMLIGIGVQAAFGLHIAMPEPVLYAAYALIGWSVGLRFEPALLRAVLRLMPKLFGATLALILLCAVMAVGVAQVFGLDLMTCFLAMSPGGIDAVAIIAAGTGANLAFVLAVQSLRMLVTILVMPVAVRAVLRRAGYS